MLTLDGTPLRVFYVHGAISLNSLCVLGAHAYVVTYSHSNEAGVAKLNLPLIALHGDEVTDEPGEPLMLGPAAKARRWPRWDIRKAREAEELVAAVKAVAAAKKDEEDAAAMDAVWERLWGAASDRSDGPQRTNA